MIINQLEKCASDGEINQEDSVIFNATLMRPDEEKLKNVFVGDPVERSSKILFTVRAFDAEGDFEVQRRFNEFEALRKSFCHRLPGLYIPKLPKGSFFRESKDIKFLQERAFHLEQFMKKVCRLPYLL